LTEEVDDVEREVFDACFDAAAADVNWTAVSGPSFRHYLLSLVRDAARRVEDFHRREYGDLPAPGADESDLARRFDLVWARQVMREAATRQKARAMLRGQDAMRRAELLRLRVRHGLDLDAVSRRWKVDPAVLVREERLARGEFDAALREVLAYHCVGDVEAASAEREHLLDALAASR
jgi:hypothetical protein